MNKLIIGNGRLTDENNYTPGEEITVIEDLSLTPVFTDNTVSLDDKTVSNLAGLLSTIIRTHFDNLKKAA